MPQLGPMELGIILMIVIIIFGVGKLPQVGGAIGKAIRDFRRAQQEDDEPKAPSQASSVAKDEEEQKTG